MWEKYPEEWKKTRAIEAGGTFRKFRKDYSLQELEEKFEAEEAINIDIQPQEESKQLNLFGYGARRISEELTAKGEIYGRTKATALMCLANVAAKQKKKFKATTDR